MIHADTPADGETKKSKRATNKREGEKRERVRGAKEVRGEGESDPAQRV